MGTVMHNVLFEVCVANNVSPEAFIKVRLL